MTLRPLFSAVNLIGGALERAGVAPPLDVERLKAAAARRARLEDFGDPRYADGLDALVQSARRDARFNTLGKIVFEQSVVRQLANRLIWVDAQKTRASYFQTPLKPPIIIIGQPRTGTTLLHRLLALDPRFRGVRAFEVFYPFPWQPAETRLKRAKRTLGFLSAAVPDLARKHEMQAGEPEECTGVMAMSFLSYAWWGFGPLYGYIEWLLAQDETRAYEEYKTILHLFQSVDPERRLVLKSPAHTPNIRLLKRLMPDAILIQTHREPVSVISSMNSLAASFHDVVSEADIPRMARFHIALQAEFMRRNMAQKAALPGAVHDVFYSDLVEEPLCVLRQVYERNGLEWEPELEARANVWLAANRQHKRGAHDYEPEDFGIEPVEIKNAFREYLATAGDRL